MAELSTYWDNHLRVAFEQSAAHDLPAMVEASLAHVLMLTTTGAMSRERGTLLERGLLALWSEWGEGMDPPPFDGSVEDPYYYLEQQLAARMGIDAGDLDVQLARSRNDLDAAVFRMISRRMILDQGALLGALTDATHERARSLAGHVIVGMTHRRPAQPTTMGHVLSGLAEAWTRHLAELVAVYDGLNESPLGGAAFAGTDVPYDAALVQRLLGFSSTYTSSYEAIAGADHFLRTAAVQGQIAATSARWARVLQEWMSLRWISTPVEFTQGSSIMPQKVNPVVCEHLVSMAGATLGDMQAVYTNVAQSWYEDSNNATTDVQQHLWRNSDRIERILRLQTGLMQRLEPLEPPTPESIVASGATTTAVAEALALAGVPWRSAHTVVHQLTTRANPTEWTPRLVERTLAEAGLDVVLASEVVIAARNPSLVLQRTQAGSPGRTAVVSALNATSARAQALIDAMDSRGTALQKARDDLVRRARDLAIR